MVVAVAKETFVIILPSSTEESTIALKLTVPIYPAPRLKRVHLIAETGELSNSFQTPLWLYKMLIPSPFAEEKT